MYDTSSITLAVCVDQTSEKFRILWCRPNDANNLYGHCRSKQIVTLLAHVWFLFDG